MKNSINTPVENLSINKSVAACRWVDNSPELVKITNDLLDANNAKGLEDVLEDLLNIWLCSFESTIEDRDHIVTNITEIRHFLRSLPQLEKIRQ